METEGFQDILELFDDLTLLFMKSHSKRTSGRKATAETTNILCSFCKNTGHYAKNVWSTLTRIKHVTHSVDLHT